MRRLALAALLLLTACGGESGTPPAEPAGPSGSSEEPPALTAPAEAWSATIAFEAGVKLGGCDVGDLDPTTAGDEIAAVAVDGRVFLVSHASGAWEGKEIAKVDGEMIQCAIGDADPAREGNELVIVGMKEGTEGGGGSGMAHLVFYADGAWHVEAIVEDSALLHGAAIGELDGDHEGDEVVVVGFSRLATVLGRTDDGWETLAQVGIGSPGKTATVYRGAAMVACSGGTVTAVGKTDGAWNTHPLELGPIGPARIASDGRELLVACDDGGLRLFTNDGVETIHQETKKLRGAVLADVDTLVAGTEAATAGYDKTITLLYPPVAPAGSGPASAAWTPVTVWRDTDRIHHLAAGELWAEGLGLELVAVGYSGRVIVVARTRR